MQYEFYRQEFFKAMPYPARPLCSDDLSHGLWRSPLDEALEQPYIQANPQQRIWALIFDVDRPAAAFAWDDASLPPPTWTAMNPRNGHAHLGYTLNTPVARSDTARLKPIRLLARIQHAMTEALNADRAYTGLITKTPTHPQWHTDVWRPAPYDLDELRDWLPDNLPLPQRIKKSESLGLGRNVFLFESLRQWAYRNRRHASAFEPWLAACLEHGQAVNTFTTPLLPNEVKATAKSVAKWTWSRFDVAASDARFSALQGYRGRKGGNASGIARASHRMDRLQKMMSISL